MKQLTLLMAPLVISSSLSWFRPPPPPSQFRPPPDPPPRTSPSVPPEPPFETLSPSEPPLEALSPSEPPLEAVSPPEPPPETLSPPEPPDPPDAPFTLVFLLLLDTSCAFSQPVSKAPDLESCLLNMAFVFCDEVASLVYVGDTSFVFKYWYPADCSVVLCWCDLIHSTRPLSMIVIVSIESTMGWSIPITISVSLPRPFIQVLSERFSKLMLDDELISLVWYFGLSRGPFTAVCSFFTAVCSSIFVILKSFQLWQLNGLMHHISIHCLASSVMEFVPLPISLSTLCGFVAGSVMLKIRDTSNTEVLIKGFIAMLKIVDCALVAASILEIISLIVVSNFQGVVSLYSLMVVENRGLLDFISCLSVLYARILLCCICFFVLVVCLAYVALFSCFMNTSSIRGE
ncbi:unnamed protein product [Brassica rapa]|nr:unnamed protein product [Brassica napus]CAG7875058.1 unnamed protein product [Brassica rapa]VDC70738.1 unnamed protein product [Brassica rapa]